MNKNQHIVTGIKEDGKEEILGSELSYGEMRAMVREPRKGFVTVTGNFKGETPKMINSSPQSGLPQKPAPELTGKEK